MIVEEGRGRECGREKRECEAEGRVQRWGSEEEGEDGRETEEGEGEQRGREKTNCSTALICFSVRGMQREGMGVTFILFSLPVAIRRIDN